MDKLKIKYSPLEQKILDAIPKNGNYISTLELAGRVYEPGKAPRYARQSVLHTANCLIQKSDEFEEPWEIFKTDSKPAYLYMQKRGK